MPSVYSLKERLMLTCIYHPIDPMRIVEADEAEKMMASGVWFDSPTKAREYRERVEEEIKNDTKEKRKGKPK